MGDAGLYPLPLKLPTSVLALILSLCFLLNESWCSPTAGRGSERPIVGVEGRWRGTSARGPRRWERRKVLRLVRPQNWED